MDHKTIYKKLKRDILKHIHMKNVEYSTGGKSLERNNSSEHYYVPCILCAVNYEMPECRDQIFIFVKRLCTGVNLLKVC